MQFSKCLHRSLFFIIVLIVSDSGFECLFAQDVWREDTYDHFIDGTLDDAGANMYISAKGNIQTANKWDVNGDGNLDILCVNSHPLVEMLDMSIYWGNGKDFSILNHSYIPANGPMWVTAGDLNVDGETDLVVANYSNGTWTEMESFVYYGGLKDSMSQSNGDNWAFYPFKERFMLPGSNTQKAAIGDFNQDGYPDIVFAFSGGFWEYRDKSKDGSTPSRIYWGSEQGFDPENYANIWTRGATDVVTADLNQDNHLDLVFANGEGNKSYIYYGSSDDFSDGNRIQLSTNKPHAVEIGDVNNDGQSDVVFANESGQTSVAYLNEGGKFSDSRSLLFQTYNAKDVLIEDFNRDGYNDLFFTNHQFSLTGDPKLANRLINSFIYYGSEDGFRQENRQDIQTIGAWGANAADLNADGWIDLLVCNFQEHYSYEVPSFIYWNGPQGFLTTHRTPLYEHGAQGNEIADFNGDGHLDVLITSMMGNSRGDYDPNFLYWGNDMGEYSIDRRLELPGREAYEQAFSDLNQDGQVDILLLNRGEVTREANECWIYWNHKNKFSTWRMSGLPSDGGQGVEVADLDKDGYLDVIISNRNAGRMLDSGEPEIGSFIYWGSETGWPVAERTDLPIIMTRAVSVCDINQDSHLDLVFGQQGKWGDASIFYGDGSRKFSADSRIRIEESNGAGTPGVADLDKDGRLDIAFAHDKHVLVYYQDETGRFTTDQMTKINVMAKTMCVADVDRDGWLDLVCPFYKGNGKRSWVSTILLGGPEGYNLQRNIQLPTDGGTGSIVSDFNHDGFQDVFFFCHRADGSYDQIGKFGDHHTNSLLYYGSAQGFSVEDRLEIPSVGVHYDVGIDLGHIRDRSFVYEYISSPYQSNEKKPKYLRWKADLPPRTSLRFQLRTADRIEDLTETEWQGPQDSDSYYTNPQSKINNLRAGSWIQYRALFDTENGVNSPILDAVEIEFE